MRAGLRTIAVTGLAASTLAVTASAASASTTIGQLAPPNPPAQCSLNQNDTWQVSVGAGNTYTVPAGGGTITSWSTNAAAGPGQVLKLKVFRFVSAATYQVVGHDVPRALTPSSLNTFGGLSIPVQAGDLLGLNTQNAGAVANACFFNPGVPGDIADANESGTDFADGLTENTTNLGPGVRLNLTAEVSPSTTASPGSAATGQRAAALARCKKKFRHNHKKRKKCLKRAKKLPA